MRWLLAPYAEGRTYRTLLYMLLGLPLGIFEFVVAVTGLALGFGLFITLLGIPILVTTLLMVRALASMERRLAASLLDIPMASPGTAPEGGSGMSWARVRELAASRRIWTEVAYLLLRLPLGTLDFVVAVTIIALAVMGPIQPIIVAAGVESQIGSWTIDTISESLILLPVSALFILVGPRMVLGWAAVSGRVASAFLGREARGAASSGDRSSQALSSPHS